MIRPIVQVKEKSLRLTSKPVAKVDKKVKALIKDLKDTLTVQKDPEGVGLAAPQIGKNVRMFVMLTKHGIKTVINPEVLEITKGKVKGKKTKILEGCLSLPNYYGPLVRAHSLKLKYLDEDGHETTETFNGFDAQIVQHEIDHLEGVLFIDRLFEQKKPLYEYVDEEWQEVELV